MGKFLQEETPHKVLGLLGVALTSMFFMFAVSTTTASFNGTETKLPDPFAPQKVVALIDNVSNQYSKVVYAYVVDPAQQQLAFVADNVNFVVNEDSPQIVHYLGLDPLAQATVEPQVLGASTQVIKSPYYSSSGGGLSINSLYSVLIK